MGESPGGRLLLDAVRGKGPLEDLDERLPAIEQLAETSDVLEEMRSTPIPESVRFISLGASGDLTVPGTATADPQADVQRLIPAPVGRDTHGDLAEMPATTREVALALAGRGATCQSGWVAAGAFFQADVLRSTETTASLVLALEAACSDPDRTGGGVDGGRLTDAARWDRSDEVR